MSLQNLETMSHAHTFNGDTAPDRPELVQIHTRMSPDPVAPPIVHETDMVAGPDRESTKSLQVSTTKRRKVSVNCSAPPLSRRETRSGGVIPPPPPQRTRAPQKRKTPDENKVAAKAARQKQLHDTYERHDNKVRELFHLTKFVTLVDYDAKAAKEDESEVFKEVCSTCLV